QQEIDLLKRQVDHYKGLYRQEQIGQLVFKTQVQVAAIRRFTIKAAVDYKPLTQGVIDQMVESSYRRQYPGRALPLTAWFMEILGALPPDTDLIPLVKSLMGEQAAGLYDPKTKVLYVKEDFPLLTTVGRMVLAHETCHALQDQDYALDKLGVEEAGDDDRAMAALAIVEGDATLLMTEFLARTGQIFNILMDLPRMLMMDQDKLNNAPAVIQESLIFPYIGGMNFFTTLNGRTPGRPDSPPRNDEPRWRGEIFTTPPRTTEQVMHPEKYLARELPADIPPPDAAGYAHLVRNVAGEFNIGALFEQALGKTRAFAAAEGWNGDRLLLAESGAGADGGGRRLVRWSTRWDTPGDATEFADALAAALSAHFGPELRWDHAAGERNGAAATAKMKISLPSPAAVEFEGIFTVATPAPPAGEGRVASSAVR
ncbi:MAG: hypothetical protein M1457_13945, partial [bacterium]|nr:hypothetical protein [bacterium]